MLSIIKAPHTVFTVKAKPSLVSPLELLVPGALVYGLPDGISPYSIGWGKLRVRWDASHQCSHGYEGPGREPPSTQVFVATHGAWLVENFLIANKFHYEIKRTSEPKFINRNDDDLSAYMLRLGRGVLHEMAEVKWIKPGWDTQAFDRQAEAVGYAISGLPCELLTWDGGSGKTIAAILTMLAMGYRKRGTMACVVPGNTRPGWRDDFAKVSTLYPYVCWAKDKGGGGLAFFKYIEDMERKGVPPVLVVGRERLPEWFNALKSIKLAAVGLDEIDACAPSPQLYRNIKFLPDGSMEVTKKRTTARGSINRGAAFVELMSRQDLRFRMGLTATPLNKGVPDKVWPIFNLLWPGSMGFSDFNFKQRYCGGQLNEWGRWEYPRGTNMGELSQRSAFILHYVSKEESAKGRPPVTYGLLKVDKSSQDRTKAKTMFDDKMSWSQAIKYVAKNEKTKVDDGLEAEDISLQNTNLTEISSAYACAIKRTAVTEKAVEYAVSGKRIIIGVGRKKEAREWAAACEALIKKKMQKGADLPPVYMATGDYHLDDRMETVRRWREAPGILIITYQAMGRGVDGMQHAHLMIAAQLPGRNTATLEQFFVRGDRVGRNHEMECLIAVAEGTADMENIKRLAEGYDAFINFFRDDTFTDIKKLLEDRMDVKSAVDEWADGLF
jgi:hypothetical protein